MQKPELPSNESQRLNALRAFDVLDTPDEERFDRFTRLARRLFNVPIALVSLVDAERQWFKSRQGLDARETPRDISFCGHTILDDHTFVVPDASVDVRFHDNPLVVDEPHIRFYAGHPLRSPCGARVGTLCIIDCEPRTFSNLDLALLRDLADMVTAELAALELATLDELTGLTNRRGFTIVAKHSLSACARSGQVATLLYFDLDRFKPINDRFGHAEGDRALEEFSTLMLECFRDSDVVARLGGDEFCVLLTGSSATEAALARKRFQLVVEERNAVTTKGYELSYSVGLAEMTVDADVEETLQSLLQQADLDMYARKAGSREPRRFEAAS